MSKADFEVVNVVGTVSYRQELDLDELASTFEKRDEIASVSYNPADVHWVQTYFEPDDTYVAFYRRGDCSITGADSIEHFEEIAGRANSVMRDLLGFDFTPTSVVSNIVVTSSLDIEVKLEEIVIALGLEDTEYEPEQFPAVIYRGYEPDAVVLVFSSGKILCTGLDDFEEIRTTIDDFAQKINQATS
jgi:transcription initiation factor TFIID TATA-box-binding protein